MGERNECKMGQLVLDVCCQSFMREAQGLIIFSQFEDFYLIGAWFFKKGVSGNCEGGLIFILIKWDLLSDTPIKNYAIYSWIVDYEPIWINFFFKEKVFIFIKNIFINFYKYLDITFKKKYFN